MGGNQMRAVVLHSHATAKKIARELKGFYAASQ
jgi:hypothetical protein